MFLLLLLWSWPILGILSTLYMIIDEEKELTVGNLLLGIMFGSMLGWLAFGLVLMTDKRIERLLEIQLWSRK